VTCPCGQPLHYREPYVQELVERIVQRLGPDIAITALETGRTWLVPRHYIALHGLNSADLPVLADVYGFPEVP